MKARLIKSDGGRSLSGFLHERNDCTVRALAVLTEAGYERAHNALAVAGRKDCDGFRFGDWRYRGRIPMGLLANGGRKGHIIPIYSGEVARIVRQAGARTFARVSAVLNTGKWIFESTDHVAAVVDGQIYDAFDSSRRRVVALYRYWESQA